MPPKPKPKTAGAGAATAAPRPFRLPVSGLEVGLLDVGRFVALNGYAHECRLLPFLSRSFRREEDFLVACKHVRYGGKQRTRLMSLALFVDVDRVSLLLKVGADVNAADTDGMTPLSLSCAGGHVDVVRLLLLGSVDVTAEGRDGRTALHHASIGGHLDVVRLLLTVKEVNVAARDRRSWTPLHHAECYGHHAITELLVKKVACLDWGDGKGNTVLDWAVEEDDLDSVRRLVALGATVSDENIFHLQDACIAGNVELVRALLVEREKDDEKQRGIDQEDRRGWTPLLHAEHHGHRAIVELLAKAGARMDWWDPDGKTVLDWAIDEGDEASVRRLVGLGAAVSGEYIFHLQDASIAGNVELVRLLLELGADVNASDYDRGWTPLLYAEHNGHIDVTEVLVGAGAYIDWRGEKDGRSVLDWAIERDDVASIRRLVGLGATIRKVDGQYWTPLHMACIGGHTRAVRALLELGADVDATGGGSWEEDGFSGHTALHIICERGFAETARALIERGADAAARDEDGNTPLELAVRNGNTETAAVVEEAVKAKAAAGGV
jgi:ankyrin repeat protein